MELETLLPKDSEYDQINELYEECLHYLKTIKTDDLLMLCNEQEKPMVLKELNEIDKTYSDDPLYETIKPAENLNASNGVMNSNVTYNPIYEDKEDNVSATDPVYESKVNKNVETGTKDKEPNIGFRVDELQESSRIRDNRPKIGFVVENELKSTESLDSLPSESKPGRLRRLSQQLPKIVITKTQSTSSINKPQSKTQITSSKKPEIKTRRSSSIHKPDTRAQSTITINRQQVPKANKPLKLFNIQRMPIVTSDGRKRPLNYDSNFRTTGFLRKGYGDFPKRLVSKSGMEHIALISNVPYEKIRLLNDTFHTLINLRWRWIVMGTIIVHFAMWLVFAVFWYITALSHYDFEPDPPKKPCITGGKDFVTIFLASVEAQTTIGFGDRAIDEECPESIFLFIMQLILGTGLSGVLTCVVYAKLTRPEKLSRDGVGFSKKAVISVRDGRLCLMMRAWDLNYDHIIGSEFCAHFINTHRTKEGETIRYHAATLPLSQKQFLLWPVTLVHEIDAASPLYRYSPEHLVNGSYEIAVSLKGASASMGTFTQSQTSYMPKEILWGCRFPPVVKYDHRKQKYTIDHKLLDATEPVDTPRCSASELDESRSKEATPPPSPRPATPSSFGERMSGFTLERSSSFRKNGK